MPACMLFGKIALTEAKVRVMGRVCETAPVVGSVTNRDTGILPFKALAGTKALRAVVSPYVVARLVWEPEAMSVR